MWRRMLRRASWRKISCITYAAATLLLTRKDRQHFFAWLCRHKKGWIYETCSKYWRILGGHPTLLLSALCPFLFWFCVLTPNYCLFSPYSIFFIYVMIWCLLCPILICTLSSKVIFLSKRISREKKARAAFLSVSGIWFLVHPSVFVVYSEHFQSW